MLLKRQSSTCLIVASFANRYTVDWTHGWSFPCAFTHHLFVSYLIVERKLSQQSFSIGWGELEHVGLERLCHMRQRDILVMHASGGMPCAIYVFGIEKTVPASSLSVVIFFCFRNRDNKGLITYGLHLDGSSS